MNDSLDIPIFESTKFWTKVFLNALYFGHERTNERTNFYLERTKVWSYKILNARKSEDTPFWTHKSLDIGVFERTIVWTWTHK